MMQVLLVGLGAGAASALLFASIASASPLALILFFLSGLPVLIAGLGWSHWTGLVAVSAAALSLAGVFGSFFFYAFLLTVGLPAWFLSYLALLARPVGPTGAEALEWYPAGRLVFWTAVLGALVVVSAIPQLGLDSETYLAALRRGFERMIRLQTGTANDAQLQVPGVGDPNRLIDFLVMVMPPAAAVFASVTFAVNLYIAGRVVEVSGRLMRPWPDIPGMAFPRYAPVALGAAMAASFFPGLVGIVAGIFGASLLIAYALLGFAVLHAITRRMTSRGLMLAGAYAVVMVFGWPLLLLVMLGLFDTAFNLRGRILAKRGPPPPAASGR